MNDYVPELPRVERERIDSTELFGAGTAHYDILGDWMLTFEGHEWRFETWDEAIEFVGKGTHLTTPRGVS